MTEDKEQPKLKPASENIWYALATIAGEPENSNDPIIEKNRYYWNGYMYKHIAKNERDILFDSSGKEVLFLGISHLDIKHIRSCLDERGFKNEELPDMNKGIDFSKTKFSTLVSFNRFVFPKPANFYNSEFRNAVDFEQAIFIGVANFNEAIIDGIISFQGAIFKRAALFNDTYFSSIVDFRASQFATTTGFQDANFTSHPPGFFDASVSEDIDWTDAMFPGWRYKFNENAMEKMVKRQKAVKHKKAYERLALMMSKLEKTHDRHMFFQHEMRARRQLDTGLRKIPSRAMNWLYDKSCGYGYGFGRALTLWSIHIVLGAGLLFIPTPHNWAGFVNSVATSFANAHSFLGLSRGPLKTVYADYAKWDLFNVIWMFQGLFGIMFLFFLILTIRNRFKMG